MFFSFGDFGRSLTSIFRHSLATLKLSMTPKALSRSSAAREADKHYELTIGYDAEGVVTIELSSRGGW